MASPNHDFNEPFTNEAVPDDLGPIITIDPVLIGIIVVAFVIIILVAVAAVLIGLRRSNQVILEQREKSAKAIYLHINDALNKALMAQGVARIDKARELKDILDARLGPLMAFNEKHLKAFKTLKKALEPPVDEPQKPDSPPKPPEIKVAVGAEELSLIIWKALQKFKTVWGDKDRILALISAAQEELTRDPSPPKPFIRANSKPIRKTVATRPAPVAPTQKPAVSPKSEDTPPPPPPPPPSGGGKGRNLPPHKKNMLA